MSRHTVILHADDFGMSPAVNRGIARAFQDGLLTSTSLLVNAPAAESACLEWPRILAGQRETCHDSTAIRYEIDDSCQPFDLGIHLNLTQGKPLTGERYPKELLDETGSFPGIGALFRRLVFVRSRIREGVCAELQSQIEWMCDHRLQPTHLNGHQYIELLPTVAEMIPRFMKRYGISVVRVAIESRLFNTVLMQGRGIAYALALVKQQFARRFLRRMQTAGAAFPNQFFGTAHAGRIDRATMNRCLAYASGVSTTEIGLHPGEAVGHDVSSMISSRTSADREWDDALAHRRPQELGWLCSPELRVEILNRRLRLGRLHPLGTSSR